LGHSKGTSCRTPLAKILDPPLQLMAAGGPQMLATSNVTGQNVALSVILHHLEVSLAAAAALRSCD